MDTRQQEDSMSLAQFADEITWCAVCWSKNLHIHHMMQGTGRQHDRIGLIRLCERCHRALHDGGSFAVTKGHVLAAKREQDPDYYDPAGLAAMKHRRALSYEPEPYTWNILRERRRHGPPMEYLAMAINSRSKGARGERDAAAALNEICPHAMARRGQQHSGTETSADLVTPGMPRLWVEVKRVQRLNVHAVMDKAADQSGQLTPVVMHRKNQEEWLLTMRLSDVVNVAREILNETLSQD
jgi:hypothetical protein